MLGERRTRQLLCNLCVELGFCLPADDIERLVNVPPGDAVTFIDAVFAAEGLHPDNVDRHLYRRVREMVTANFREVSSG